jgi:NADPH-dependent 2,4-dienoyl-CoA reductase/sulfur reductase-like enzyme
MLPDWPDIKEEIARAFMRHAAERVRQRSVAGIAVAVPVHEGHGHFTQHADGRTEERAFERAGAEVAIPADAIKSESRVTYSLGWSRSSKPLRARLARLCSR